jgi:hypothetical protein
MCSLIYGLVNALIQRHLLWTIQFIESLRNKYSSQATRAISSLLAYYKLTPKVNQPFENLSLISIRPFKLRPTCHTGLQASSI